MKVKSFEEFWEDEIESCPSCYRDSYGVTQLKELAKRAWEQATYTSNNAPR